MTTIVSKKLEDSAKHCCRGRLTLILANRCELGRYSSLLAALRAASMRACAWRAAISADGDVDAQSRIDHVVLGVFQSPSRPA